MKACAAIVAVIAASPGCAVERPMKVPGETDIEIEAVRIEGHEGADLTPDHRPLIARLGMRAPTLILPGRYYSEFREAEDRRRIEAFWHNFGFFDVEVDEPETIVSDDEQRIAITWKVRENERYTIAEVQLVNAPPEYAERLAEMIPFEAGAEEVDLEQYRKVRIEMYDFLRQEGFGHAGVYSRAFLDRKAKRIHWYYYVDAGPKTRVGKVTVAGNVKVPSEVIMERVGMHPGDPYDDATKLAREFDLLDTGAFASVFIRTTADTTFLVPGDAPDTGGIMRPEQVDEEGNLVPRELPEEIDLKIHVVEAPSQQLRIRAGLEVDPSRIDTALGSRLWLRNLFGPFHHLVLEGRIGYGWLWRAETDDPTGLYGEALVRYLAPMLIARTVDFRLSARFRDELFPGFHLREVTAGPGLRSTLAPGLFVDGDLFFRFGQQVDFGPFDEVTREAHDLAADDIYLGGEVQASLVWDRRDNPVEALSGHLLALRTSFSPGGVDRWNRYLTILPEARGFLPLSSSFSFGLRGNAGWALASDERGIPLGPRLFGGGGHGMRGFARHQLSPYVPPCGEDSEGALLCDGEPVGAKSLVEGSLEGRFLPPLEPYGLVGFVDVGGAGRRENPFEAGVSLAAGLGARLRFWYLPAALDFSYRILRENEVQEPADDPFLVFFRLGEAF